MTSVLFIFVIATIFFALANFVGRFFAGGGWLFFGMWYTIIEEEFSIGTFVGVYAGM